MKRSEINSRIKSAVRLLQENNIALPFFGYLTADEWRKSDIEYTEIKKHMLGWDVTDFGSGDFDRIGAVLFTVRNGSPAEAAYSGTPYAEKYLIFDDTYEQEIPLHCHITKTEDIINRAGGLLAVQLYGSCSCAENVYAVDETAESVVYTDGVRRIVPAGGILYIERGNSITLTPGVFHRLYAVGGHGMLIAGEVSSINDDRTDNVFKSDTDRFCKIDEDEEIIYPLCGETSDIK